ncbi:hypothetical protein EST38_g14155, partial [Candolleomyces aberdarensis]
NYLIQHEIIALHLAQNQGRAGVYAACAQICIGSSGTAVPTKDELVLFPGAYRNVFDNRLNYQFPGAAVSRLAGTAAPTSDSTPSSTKTSSSSKVTSTSLSGNGNGNSGSTSGPKTCCYDTTTIGFDVVESWAFGTDDFAIGALAKSFGLLLCLKSNGWNLVDDRRDWGSRYVPPEELKIVGSEVGSGIKEFEDSSELWRSRGSTDATACGVKEIVDDSADDKATDMELEFGVYAEIDIEFGNEEVIGDFASSVELEHTTGRIGEESRIRVMSSQVVDF